MRIEYTISLSEDGLKQQFGKIPTDSEMVEIITKALSSYVFEQRILNNGEDCPIPKKGVKNGK